MLLDNPRINVTKLLSNHMSVLKPLFRDSFFPSLNPLTYFNSNIISVSQSPPILHTSAPPPSLSVTCFVHHKAADTAFICNDWAEFIEMSLLFIFYYYIYH